MRRVYINTYNVNGVRDLVEQDLRITKTCFKQIITSSFIRCLALLSNKTRLFWLVVEMGRFHTWLWTRGGLAVSYCSAWFSLSNVFSLLQWSLSGWSFIRCCSILSLTSSPDQWTAVMEELVAPLVGRSSVDCVRSPAIEGCSGSPDSYRGSCDATY